MCNAAACKIAAKEALHWSLQIVRSRSFYRASVDYVMLPLNWDRTKTWNGSRNESKNGSELERNLDQLSHVASKIIFAAGGKPSSKRYFMDKLLVTEACSDASDAENWDPLYLPHIF